MGDGWARRSPLQSNGALVAHWAFTERGGYVVHDHVGSHDLQALYEPTWVVLPDTAAVCGDGVVSRVEGCDLGSEMNGRGHGCTADCQVEAGWECSAGPPSKCWPANKGAEDGVLMRRRWGPAALKQKKRGPRRYRSITTTWYLLGAVLVAFVAVFVVYTRQQSVEWRGHRMRNMGAELLGGPYVPLPTSAAST